MQRALLPLIVLCSSVSPLHAHKGMKHLPPGQPVASVPERDAKKPSRRFEEINALYVKAIRPSPKQLIERDMRQAKEHMDMRRDFPFGGHGTPTEDLDALTGMLADGSMRPWRYRIMHWGTKLTKQEAAEIDAWVRSSRAILAEDAVSAGR